MGVDMERSGQFIQQIFIEHILCAICHSGHYGYCSEQNAKIPAPRELVFYQGQMRNKDIKYMA